MSSGAAVALQLLLRSAKITRTVLAIEAATAAELAADADLSEPLRAIVDLVTASLDGELATNELIASVESELY